MLDNISIIKQLFRGEIHPAESIDRNRSSEIRQFEKTLNEANNGFMKLLSDSNLSKFRALLELQTQNTGLYGAECFNYGFKLGMRILLEVLPDGESLSLIKLELFSKNSLGDES